jgi:hypothetical protein
MAERKTWVLDTETKGTGAHVVPLEKALKNPESAPRRQRRRADAPPGERPRSRRPRGPVETSSSPLPAGHVRKKATGEIGQVQAVDPKAGTATVRWLKQGRTSTVPLASVSRR